MCRGCGSASWFRVMDPRLLALPQVGGDLSRVNVDATRRSALCRKYGRPGTLTV